MYKDCRQLINPRDHKDHYRVFTRERPGSRESVLHQSQSTELPSLSYVLFVCALQIGVWFVRCWCNVAFKDIRSAGPAAYWFFITNNRLNVCLIAAVLTVTIAAVATTALWPPLSHALQINSCLGPPREPQQTISVMPPAGQRPSTVSPPWVQVFGLKHCQPLWGAGTTS